MAEIKSSSENILQPVGYVVSGGLKENLNVRLTVPAHLVQEGSFVVIESGDWQFYGIATDLQLGATDPRFADEQSETRLPAALAGLLHGQTLFTNLVVMPALMLERGPDPSSPLYSAWRMPIDSGDKEEPHPMPVKTLPAHHAQARLMTLPRSLVIRMNRVTSLSAPPVNRTTRCVSTWINLYSALPVSLAPPAQASLSLRASCWPG
jgi:hypothetical protein